MARFNAEGIEGLALSFEEFANIPDDVVENILLAGGEVIRDAHAEAINRKFAKHTGHLLGSPTIISKAGGKSNGFNRHVLVYPQGEHHKYHAKSRAYIDHNWGRIGGIKQTKGGEKSATNSDVGFVHEFGGHGNDASQWMREANEKAADAMVDAELAVYDAWLNTLKL